MIERLRLGIEIRLVGVVVWSYCWIEGGDGTGPCVRQGECCWRKCLFPGLDGFKGPDIHIPWVLYVDVLLQAIIWQGSISHSYASMRFMDVSVFVLLDNSCFVFGWLLHIQKHHWLREI